MIGMRFLCVVLAVLSVLVAVSTPLKVFEPLQV